MLVPVQGMAASREAKRRRRLPRSVSGSGLVKENVARRGGSGGFQGVRRLLRIRRLGQRGEQLRDFLNHPSLAKLSKARERPFQQGAPFQSPRPTSRSPAGPPGWTGESIAITASGMGTENRVDARSS